MWLTDHNDTMTSLLKKTGLSIDAKTDEIADALMDLKQISMKIDILIF